MTQPPAAPAARLGRRAWIGIAASIIVFVTVYGIVISLYDVEGGFDQTGGVATASPTGFTAIVTPIAVRPLTSTATVRVSFRAVGDELLDDSGRLGQNTRVTVVTETGVDERRFPAGTVPTPVEVEIGIDGDQSRYPFDAHAGEMVVVLDSYSVAEDGSISSTGPLPVSLGASGGVSGWNTDVELTPPGDEGLASFDFTRAFSTQAFALLILAMSVVLAALALTAGVLMKTRRRIVEATLLSWAAALLFALPALRNFMPNAPPIGAAIDIYVFLWVMVAAVSAAALVILAWIERDRPGRGDDHAA